MAMPAASHVFISFKTEERENAFRLKTALVSSGYAVWWQEEIQCGQEWHGEIDQAIEEAGAIVVLWSTLSMHSIWVRHEASQAIIKGVYTPVRIEVMEIASPYNRIQATDMINWSGEASHPGFQNLLTRLKELMPPPVSVWHQSARFLWKQRSVILSSAIAAVALLLLLRQSAVLNEQIKKQDQTFLNVQKQSVTLQSQGAALQSQLEKQDALVTQGRKQSEALTEQLEQQRLLSGTVRQQSSVLNSQLQKQEKLSEQSSKIIASQLALSHGLDSSMALLHGNLEGQERSYSALKTTAEDIKSLNYPVANGLGYTFKMKIYVEGTKNLWPEKNNTPYTLLAQGDTVSAFVQKRVHRFSKNDYKNVEPYQRFFGTVASGIGVTPVVNYQLAGKENTIVYYENGVNIFNYYTCLKNIIYNPRDESFESEFTVQSGVVNTNPDKITSLFPLFDNASVIMLFRFAGEENHFLPVNGSQKASVKIKKIELSELSQLRYGNNFQFMMYPNDRVKRIGASDIRALKNFDAKIKEADLWRYCFISLPLARN